jgi:hypothetical protein
VLGGLVDDGRAGGRPRALTRAYCWLCWCQASLEAKGLHMVLPPFLAQLRHHQLFFAGMNQAGGITRRVTPTARHTNWQTSPFWSPALRAGSPSTLPCFEIRRDFSWFERQAHANLAN